MQTAIEQFRVNIERARSLGALTMVLNAQTTAALDFSDMLRAEIVLAVSALDHYVHEIVRLGMLDIYRGNRPTTRHFLRFQVSINSVTQAVSDPANVDWLEQEIRNRNGFQSFQNYEKMADAIRLVSEVRLWDAVAGHIGMTTEDVKITLTLIINRRNQIAHEADLDPSYAGVVLWSIDNQIVDGSVDFIEQVAEAIYTIVS